MEVVNPASPDSTVSAPVTVVNTSVVSSERKVTGIVTQGASDLSSKALDPQTSIEGVKKTFNQINEVLKQSRASIQFEVDSEADRVIIKVVDQETGELIRQIPSEEALRVSKNFTQYLERIHADEQEYDQRNRSSSQSLGLIMDNQA